MSGVFRLRDSETWKQNGSCNEEGVHMEENSRVLSGSQSCRVSTRSDLESTRVNLSVFSLQRTFKTKKSKCTSYLNSGPNE